MCIGNAVQYIHYFGIISIQLKRQVGQAVTRSSLDRGVSGSTPGPVKSDAVLPTALHRCGILSEGTVLLTGAMTRKMSFANPLQP